MSRKAALILAAAVAVVVIAGGVVAALVFMGGIRDDTDQRARNIVDRLRQVASQVNYQTVESAGLSGGLVFRDMNVRFEGDSGFRAQAVEIGEFDWDRPTNRIPHYLDVRLRGVTLDPGRQAGRDPEVRRLTGIFLLGDEQYPSDVHYRYRYDSELQTLEMETETETEGLASATFFMKLGNVPTLDVENQEAMGARALGVTLIRASLTYSDQSYVERALAKYAEQQGMTVEEARAKTLNELRTERSAAETDFQRELIDAAITFMQDPGDFRIEANPPSAVPLFSLILMGGDAERVRQQFGLSVSVTPGSER